MSKNLRALLTLLSGLCFYLPHMVAWATPVAPFCFIVRQSSIWIGMALFAFVQLNRPGLPVPFLEYHIKLLASCIASTFIVADLIFVFDCCSTPLAGSITQLSVCIDSSGYIYDSPHMDTCSELQKRGMLLLATQSVLHHLQYLTSAVYLGSIFIKRRQEGLTCPDSIPKA